MYLKVSIVVFNNSCPFLNTNPNEFCSHLSEKIKSLPGQKAGFLHSISSKIMTSEGKETGEKERARRRERRRREKRKEKKQKTMVALFVSLKVLRVDPMNVHVGSNKSGDWYYIWYKIHWVQQLGGFHVHWSHQDPIIQGEQCQNNYGPAFF